MKKLALIKLLIVLTLVFAPVVCSAMPNNTLIAQVQINPDLKPEYAAGSIIVKDDRTFQARYIFQLLAGSLIYLAGPLAVLMLAIGGLRYVMSHGDQTQMDEAKKTITYAIVGLLVIVLSYAIISNIIRLTTTTDIGTTGTETNQSDSKSDTPADTPAETPEDPNKNIVDDE